MAGCGLYKAADGSWRQADASTGVRFFYKLRDRERWTLLDDGSVLVVHPDRPAQSRLCGRARGGDRTAALATTDTGWRGKRSSAANAGQGRYAVAPGWFFINF